jgi:sugar-specific transcriptional regulator TrmB
MQSMSYKRVIKTLRSLGLSKTDANVYVYLATEGPQGAKNIGDALKLREQILHQSLENLQGKGVVSSKLEQSALFSALPFDKALELLVKAHLKEAQNIERDKTEILSKWKTLTEPS